MFKFTNKISEKTWKHRYQKNGETVDENFHRVAKFLSNNEKEYRDFYRIMSKNLFYPGGRTMSNSAIGSKLSLNNCYTAPMILDSLDNIFEKVKLGAVTHQRGGKQFCLPRQQCLVKNLVNL